ncbi:MAG: hypothetical protein M3R38_16125 [Actinomycetota bacterium]|nr:hypothetical protein [Actinomycetota bacterium]
MTSSAAWPKMRSAPGLYERIIPLAVIVMIPSEAVSTTARWRASLLRRALSASLRSLMSRTAVIRTSRPL